MPASEARIAANRANALKSTGPRTEEGKARSRGNALKHGLTGAGVVLPEEAALEVERRFEAFKDELKPSGEVGLTLVRRAATMAVRMECCVKQQTAALAERVRAALAEFEAPEGVDAEEADRLRIQAAWAANFDPSKDAAQARRYESAAERGFFRALKELRQVERAAHGPGTAGRDEAFREALASFASVEKLDAKLDAMERQLDLEPLPSRPTHRASAPFPPSNGRFDLPFSIGRGR